jgi:hypothetical protein
MCANLHQWAATRVLPAQTVILGDTEKVETEDRMHVACHHVQTGSIVGRRNAIRTMDKTWLKSIQIKDNEIYIKNIEGYEDKMQASFAYLVKHRLKATNPQKYRDVNILTKDLFTLKSFYDNKTPSHPTQEDSWRFQAALDTMSERKTSMTKMQRPSATVSKCEDIMENDMEHPQQRKLQLIMSTLLVITQRLCHIPLCHTRHHTLAMVSMVIPTCSLL